MSTWDISTDLHILNSRARAVGTLSSRPWFQEQTLTTGRVKHPKGPGNCRVSQDSC